MFEKKYSKEHEWVFLENEVATVGITNHAQESLGDIVFIELPEIGKSIKMGDQVGVVESVKAASDIYTPVSCTVTEVNEELEDSPELLNEDAYANWMAIVELSDASELDDLMNSKEYDEYCTEK